MKFLCGRPGCGKDSTATLQIDAVASTVSLVDPRVSRDGVPLCARHADSTTPPLGWTMNDLRSTVTALADGGDGSGIASTPPRVRPDGGGRPLGEARMSLRQSIAERARREAVGSAHDGSDRLEGAIRDHSLDGVMAARANGARAADRRNSKGPESRPSRRREAGDEVPEEQDRFPWHFHFEDDEPAELQASTPLLSRAFRSSTG